MSYDEPDKVPLDQQNDAVIWHTTSETVRELSDELRHIGLKMSVYEYYKNEYCGDRGTPAKCGCTHWFCIKVENLFTRIYEPRCYIHICKRKSVYEIRYKGHVPKDFWIKVDNRTQEKGRYIHSYGLHQAAEDIKIAYQASEILRYRDEQFNQYYSNIFKHKEDHPTTGYGDITLEDFKKSVPEYLTLDFFVRYSGEELLIHALDYQHEIDKALQVVVDHINGKLRDKERKEVEEYEASKNEKS